MKVVILAGGYGTRLSEYTSEIPKPMVQIGNKPILWHIMKIYAEYGFKDFYVALGYKSEIIKNYFLNYKSLNNDFSINLKNGKISFYNNNGDDWNINLIDTGLKTMTGGRLKRLQKFLKNDKFMLTYGDGLSDIDINKLLKFHKNHKKMVTVTAVRPTARFGELEINSNNLDAIEFYNSDKVKVGEWVLAVGNPYNLNSTVTAGIVSAKSRNINILHNPRAVESFIQTDAVINPGNSGGALVNLEGELIGLNTAIQSNTGSYTGYGFSIPSNLVYNVVEDLKEFGYVRRAFIGVQVQDINNFISEKYDLDNNKGVLISKVIENGSAIESGIKDLDVILAINNININSVSELQEKICQFDPGDTIQCLIKRKLKKFTINIKLK